MHNDKLGANPNVCHFINALKKLARFSQSDIKIMSWKEVKPQPLYYYTGSAQ